MPLATAADLCFLLGGAWRWRLTSACRNGDINTGKTKRARALPIRRRRLPDRRTNVDALLEGRGRGRGEGEGEGAETLGVVTAAETTKVKKMDDNCRRKRKEYSERTDGGPGREERGSEDGMAALQKTCVCVCVQRVGKHTHTHTEVSADVPWPSL